MLMRGRRGIRIGCARRERIDLCDARVGVFVGFVNFACVADGKPIPVVREGRSYRSLNSLHRIVGHDRRTIGGIAGIGADIKDASTVDADGARAGIGGKEWDGKNGGSPTLGQADDCNTRFGDVVLCAVSIFDRVVNVSSRERKTDWPYRA